MNDVKSKGGSRRKLFGPMLLLLFATLLTAGVAFAGLPAGAGKPSSVGAQGKVVAPAQGTPTATATSCPPGWTIYPDPAPPGESVLNGVTALSPNDLWAVGYYTGTDRPHTLIVHSDGTNWTRVPSPDPGSGNVVLQGVTGVAPNDVWAVGS